MFDVLQHGKTKGLQAKEKESFGLMGFAVQMIVLQSFSAVIHH